MAQVTRLPDEVREVAGKLQGDLESLATIGFYVVASGVYTMIGQPLPMMGSKNLYRYLTDEIEKEVGGKWAFELDPVEAAHKMIRHIDKKRKGLKLKPPMYEQPLKYEE